tara:strand:+ start:257 stop:508 length:252 start_codon:yes stop_codon:yes gene_type:complete
MFEPKDIQKIASFIKDTAAQQAYDILIKDGPGSFGNEFPVKKFIDKLIEHYLITEQYHKCAKLQKIQEAWITNQLISEFSKTK